MPNKVNMIDLNRQAELRQAIELLFHAYRAFTAPPDRILEARGLGRVHHRILYFVARSPGTTVTALLGVLGVSKQALNAPLRQLVEAGLVDSRAGTQDKRSASQNITRTIEQISQMAEDTHQIVSSNASDVDQLKQVAGQLREGLQQFRR